jgi:peptidoglycan/LPS O-acetylase OafA/YrhL
VVLALIGLALGGNPYYGAEEGFWRWLPSPGDALPIVFYHILGAAMLLQAVIRSGVRAVFDRPTFRLLGRISYGVYLVHFTVLAALPTSRVLWMAPSIGYLPSISIAFAVTLPVTLIVAFGFAWAIDEPATRLAEWFAARMMGWKKILVSRVKCYIQRAVRTALP